MMRMQFAYTGEVLRDSADGLVSVLSEAMTQPRLWPWEVDEDKHALEGLVADIAADPLTTVTEGVHAAAYGPTAPLGHSVFASKSDLEDVDDEVLRHFLGAQFTAGNMVIAGTSEFHSAEASDVYPVLPLR